jgi:hypothetical protein
MAKTKLKNAYFDIGVVPIRTNSNKIVPTHKYIVLPERFARYLQVPVVTEPPKARTVIITRGKLKGRTKQVEFQSKISGIKYELGYYNGVAASTTDPKRGVKIKWIPIHIPRGLSSKEFLKVITTKIPRKPQFIRMPSGKSTRLTDA